MIRPAFAILATLAVAGCAKPVVAPQEADACFEASPRADKTIVFNKLSDHEPTMESCAAALEGMRQRFLGLGGSRHEIMGTYNGRFLFLGPGGVQMSDSIDGMRFPFLVRTDDGRLEAPGTVETQ
jgi:hypothetical protein